jgi:putative transposase
LAERISKHPNNEGAYTGNTPMHKPHDYGQKTVAWEDFEKLVAVEIAAHNAREGRRSDVAKGRSLQAAFDASFAQIISKRASKEQLRFCLLASADVTVDREEMSVWLHKNKYWMPEFAEYAGKRLMLRVDPANLQHGAYVYTNTGVFVGIAECVEKTGFDNREAAGAHARARRLWNRATKVQLEAERTMALSKIQRQPTPEPVTMPENTKNVVAAAFGAPKNAEEVSPEKARITELRAKADVIARERFEAKMAERRRQQS